MDRRSLPNVPESNKMLVPTPSGPLGANPRSVTSNLVARIVQWPDSLLWESSLPPTVLAVVSSAGSSLGRDSLTPAVYMIVAHAVQQMKRPILQVYSTHTSLLSRCFSARIPVFHCA